MSGRDGGPADAGTAAAALKPDARTHAYRISGLSVQSEIELPGAIPSTPVDVPDLVVRQGPVPEALPAPSASGPSWQRSGDDFLLRVPRVARILISDGRSVTVDIDPEATADDASVFVLGSSVGIVHHQRGALALHGACVAKDGRAMIVCGASGRGKSTTAAALCQRGYTLVADDISVIGSNDGGVPTVWPDGRQLKLWRRSIDGLKLDDRIGEVVRPGFEKYFVAPGDAVTDPPLLTAIYVLDSNAAVSGVSIEDVGVATAMRILDNQAYRPRLRHELSSPQARFAQSAAVLRHARVFAFERPLGFDHLDESLDALERHWRAL
jgi:hypothetical protein